MKKSKLYIIVGVGIILSTGLLYFLTKGKEKSKLEKI